MPIYRRSKDTSFKGHFKSHRQCAVRIFKREKSVLIKTAMFFGFIIAPLFWAYHSRQRSKAGEGVPVLDEDQNEKI